MQNNACDPGTSNFLLQDVFDRRLWRISTSTNKFSMNATDIIALGSKGDAVTSLQADLLALGILDARAALPELVTVTFGDATNDALRAFQSSKQLTPTGVLNDVTLDLLRRALEALVDLRSKQIFRVVGSVVNPNSTPAVEVDAHVFERELRGQHLRGQGSTDKNGDYMVSFDRSTLCRPSETNGPALQVRVTGRDGELLFEPTIDNTVFNATTLTVVNITLTTGDTKIPNEYDEITKAIQPLLCGVKISDLNQNSNVQDITFLSKETNVDPTNLQYLVISHRLFDQYMLPPQFTYGLLRENVLISTDGSSAAGVRISINLSTPLQPLFYDIVLLSTSIIQKTIEQAGDTDHLVPETVVKSLPSIIRLLSEYVQEANTYISEERPKALLSTAESFITSGAAEALLNVLQQDAGGDIVQLLQNVQSALATSSDSTTASSDVKNSNSAEKQTKISTGIHLPSDKDAIQHALKLYSIDTKNSRQLAKLDQQDWEEVLVKLVRQKGIKEYPNQTLLQQHALALTQKMEKEHPTTAFFAALERDTGAFPEHRENFLKIFASNADFDLARSNIDNMMKDTNEETTGGKPANGKTRADKTRQRRKMAGSSKAKLKSLQRVFKVVPTYRQSKLLIDHGISSSAQIHSYGEKRFVKTFGGKNGVFSKEQARTAFHKAQDIHIASGILAGQVHANSGALKIAALGTKITADQLEPVSTATPNISNLFQFGDYCDCDDCVTVWSPGAYLVDVLQWLKNREVINTVTSSTNPSPPTTNYSAKDVLFSRRPDMGETDLSCANTNTEIPYIDLVCELLEQEVSADAGISYSGPITVGPDAQHQDISPQLLTALKGMNLPFTSEAMVSESYTVTIPLTIPPKTLTERLVRDTNVVCKMTQTGSSWNIVQLRQTYGSADEVAAAPEYVNNAAYLLLENSQWAFQLPYDLYLQECRGYFGQFGISRGSFMKALQALQQLSVTTARLWPSTAAIATEDLGLSPVEESLITTSAPSQQDTYWNTPGAASVLNNVGAFLTKTSLDLTGLQALLVLPWINPKNTLYVQELKTSPTGQADCTLADMQIDGLDDAALDRLHRFIRLSKNQQSWTVTALDHLIRAKRLGNGTLDDNCLIHLDSINQLQAAMPQLTTDQLVICFDRIPTHGGISSTYNSIFLNVAAVGQINTDFQVANVRANEKKEATTPGSGELLSTSTNVAYLALCLGLSQPDVTLLISTITAPAILRFSNLAKLYALSILTPELGLKVSDLVILQSLTGIDITTSPEDTLVFISMLGEVNTASISPVDLQYYLTHQAVDLSTRALSDSMVTTILTTLQTPYLAAQAANTSAYNDSLNPTENTTAVKNLLAKLPSFNDASNLSLFQSIIDNTWQSTTVTPTQFLSQTLSKYVDTGPIDNAQASLATAFSSTPPTSADTISGLQNSFIEVVMAEVSTYLYQQAKNAVLVSTMTTQFGLSQTLVQTILMYAAIPPGLSNTNPSLNSILTNDVLITPSSSPPVIAPGGAFSTQYQAVRLLQILGGFTSAMGISTSNVEWMLQNNAALGWVQLDSLPYDTGMTAVSFRSWEQLQTFQSLSSSFPAVNNPLDPQNPYTVNGLFDLTLQTGSTVTNVITYLVQLTGWDTTTVTDLCTNLFNFQLSDFQLPATYLRLEPAVTLLRRIGADLSQAQQLIGPDLSSTETLLMRQLLKARYSDSDWLGVLKTVQDPLRTQKRDALVAYVLSSNTDLSSTDDLYDYYLIDVEMQSCMMTSRIVQAHATIQLFVERCRLGLEPTCVADFEDDSGWAQWSWMEQYRLWEANRQVFVYPENWIVPNLRDDKSELYVTLENTLSQNSWTDDNVEAAAISYLTSLDDIANMDVMAVYYDTSTYIAHIFSRTKGGTPQVYYYRQLQSEKTWTPWEKINLDISGDHLLAFERNSRLTIVWPIFTSVPQTNQPGNVPSPSQLGQNGITTSTTASQMQIQLAMSEKSPTGWKTKVVSKDPLYWPDENDYDTDLPDASQFAFFVTNLANTGQMVNVSVNITDSNGDVTQYEVGTFDLNGCKGYPEPNNASGILRTVYLPQFQNAQLETEKYIQVSDGPPNDLAEMCIFSSGNFLPLLDQTTDSWVVTYPMQMSDLDWLYMFLEIFLSLADTDRDYIAIRAPIITISLGAMMPFFFGDTERTYLVLPGLYPDRRRLELDTAKTEPAPITKLKDATFSELYPIVLNIVTLFQTYVPMYVNDPNHDLLAVLAKLVVDPTFTDLINQLTSICGLVFGNRFKNFYHPLICTLIETLNGSGFSALYTRKLELTVTDFNFASTYSPTAYIATPYPKEDLSFSTSDAYASYNWELFFHLPFEVAVNLNQNQQFEDARSWYHYIFNPVGANDVTTVPQKYWITKPFFERTPNQYVDELISTILGDIANAPGGTNLSSTLSNAVLNWRNNPYDPFIVARSRTVAFQIAIVINYIQNLIDWGDNLFAQFTRELITQATQLYILADKLLGPKPAIVKPIAVPLPETFNQIEANVDIFGNALIDFENMVPDLDLLPHKGAELPSPLGYNALYFCIPPNTNMLSYWDLVADRLFKIRNCQNINGIVTPLALFSPPIDPGALVRAAAEGISASQIASGLNAPLPIYRFRFMVQRTSELVQIVSGLGNALLQALERQDAEQLQRLQSSQQLLVLGAVKIVKQDAINEAQGQIENLNKSLAVATERYQWYSSRPYMNAWEITQATLSGTSLVLEAGVGLGHALAGALHVVPDFDVGASGFGATPVAKAKLGGSSFGPASKEGSLSLQSANTAIDKSSSLLSTQASYQRRQDEWTFQATSANLEIASINQQITTAGLHLQMAEDDLAAHQASITEQQAVDSFLHTKYTNQELYQWMISQIKSVYFNAYNLAFDAANKLERSFRVELGNSPSPAFINYGYFDSLHNGLLAADALQYDIQRMETAFYEQNVREFELSKQISLAQLDPAQLLSLKSTGTCTIFIPEAIFDLDHPGHYMRRHKAVSVSIPCIAGPYTSVSCTLTLISNKYRNTSSLKGLPYPEQQQNETRFTYNVGAVESIATSTAQDDGGLFELNFQDDRYLPFEGTGTIATWQLTMPSTFRQFNYMTITDVILHLRYTARDGGSSFATQTVQPALGKQLSTMVLAASRTGIYQYFNLKQSFPNAWWTLTQSGSTEITIGVQQLPFYIQKNSPVIDNVTWFGTVQNGNSLATSHTMSLNGTNFSLGNPDSFGMITANSGMITLGTAFMLADTDAKDLIDLNIVLHLKISV